MIPLPAGFLRSNGYPGWNPNDRTAGVALATSSTVSSCATNATFGEGARGTVYKSTSGKFYWEATVGTAGILVGIGIAKQSTLLASGAAGGAGGIVGRNGGITYRPCSGSVLYIASGSVGLVINEGVAAASSSGAMASTHVVAVAVDFTGQLIWLKNLSQTSTSGQWNLNLNGDPAAGTNGISIASFAGILMAPVAVVQYSGTGGIATINPGTSAFTGAVPAGFTSGWK